MTEAPTFKRCCFCVPLRHGLLVWSYIKLIANFFLIPLLIYTTCVALLPPLYSGNKSLISLIFLYFTMAAVTVIMFLADYVATIVFIVGVHKRNVDLINGYYIFSIGMLIVSSSLILVGLLISFNSLMTMNVFGLLVIISLILVIAIQSYVILLIKSKIFHLKTNRPASNPGYEECTKCDKVAEGQNKSSNIENV